MAASTQATTLFALTTVKSWLRITDNSQDDQIVQMADAVSQRIETVTNRYFVARSLTETYDGNGTRRLFLRKAPIVSLSTLTITDLPGGTPVTYTNGTDFDIDPRLARVQLRSGAFTRGFQNVVVPYQAGFGAQGDPALPDDVYQAGLDYVKAVYAEWSANAIAATSVSIGGSTFVLKPDIPPGIKAVLNQWKWKHL